MDPLPPWVTFKGAEPQWSGWRQGVSEAWLCDTFLPFWRGLTMQGRDKYLLKWPPPDIEWSDQLAVWVPME
jgi:hypothetical protein